MFPDNDNSEFDGNMKTQKTVCVEKLIFMDKVFPYDKTLHNAHLSYKRLKLTVVKYPFLPLLSAL